MTPSTDTKTRILDAAEALFAERGLDRVTTRDITDTAKVNLAAINYHFGHKDELVAAIIQRRVTPLNERRLAALTEAETKAGSNGPTVEQIIRAALEPELQCPGNVSNPATTAAKLFGRCLAEPPAEIEALLMKQFDPFRHRLIAALLKALPHLSRTEVFWRVRFMFGASHQWLLTRDRFNPPDIDPTNAEQQSEKLVSFIAAGLRAP